MSENAGLTVKAFFFDSDELSADQTTVLDAADCLRRAREEMRDKTPGEFWAAGRKAVAGTLQSALDTPIEDVLAGAFRTYEDLQRYRDPATPPAEVILHPLTKPRIESAHKLRIEILLGPRAIGEIDFEIRLELDLQMAILKIQAGRIMEIHLGACTASGSIFCESHVLLERRSREIRLPGVVRLGDGVPIEQPLVEKVATVLGRRGETPAAAGAGRETDA